MCICQAYKGSESQIGGLCSIVDQRAWDSKYTELRSWKGFDIVVIIIHTFQKLEI